MADVRTRARYWLLAAVPLLLCLASLFHLGPKLHLAKQEEALDSLQLPDGSTLVLTIRPNDDIIEAFTVTLRRFYPDGRAERCLAGFKESYWWFARLRMRPDRKVDLRAWACSECIFDPATGVLRWNDNFYPPQPSWRDGYRRLPPKKEKGPEHGRM
jgi:hypothetical protein